MNRKSLAAAFPHTVPVLIDRKSTRLNSSLTVTSYAVFCLKQKILFCGCDHTYDMTDNNTFHVEKGNNPKTLVYC